MYIEYECSQWYTDKDHTLCKYSKPPKKIPTVLPRPKFMPTRLLRTFDLKLVEGSQVDEGYCALSYSRDQSGERLFDEITGKPKRRIDRGKHKIIHKRRQCEVSNGNREKEKETIQIIEHVKFERLIQQICLQFNIKYIWYDQMCINQGNKEEKHHEIRNMHLIYSNAYCTVALVPEFCVQNNNKELEPTFQDFFEARKIIHHHQYFKRLWTLEEAIKSQKLLFIGKNTHSWGEDLFTIESGIYVLNRPLEELRVHEILYHAHQRTSTKEHDRVFALANLFPDIMQHLTVDYNQSIEDLMLQFYGLLVKKSIDILAFKKFSSDYDSTLQKYKFLPSWTGVNGEHRTDVSSTPNSFQNYKVVGKTIHVTCNYITNMDTLSIDYFSSFTLREADLPPIPTNEDNAIFFNYINNGNSEKKKGYYYDRLGLTVQLPGINVSRTIELFNGTYNDIIKDKDSLGQITKKLQKLACFMKIKKENLFWYSSVLLKGSEFCLDNLTDEVVDPCTQCVIFSGISFESLSGSYYPVIKKKKGEEYYTAIGTCRITNSKLFFSDCSLPKQTFLIR